MPCKSFRFVAALFLCLGVSVPCLADDVSLGMVTGPKTGTYFAVGHDIAQVAHKAGITIDVKPSEGSLDNIKRINSSENAALGIVQSDVLGFLSRSQDSQYKHLAFGLRMIFPLYKEEVHVLARKDIETFADLTSKKIAVGEQGSGNMLTATNLFSLMHVSPAQSATMTPEEGVVAVLRGEADAVIFVGGKPVRMFKNLEDLSLPENRKYADMLQQVHFLPLNDPRMLAEYAPATITGKDYDFVRTDVPTIAVQAVLVTYDFSHDDDKARCKTLGKLAGALRSALPQLQETGHPKWKEVHFDASPGLWKKDSCSWPPPKKHTAKRHKKNDDDEYGS